MKKNETLKEIIEDLNRRRRSLDVLRLLAEDGDAQAALEVARRLQADLKSVIERLEGVADGEAGQAGTRDAAGRGYLGDANEPSGFEKWVENLIGVAWDAVAHPGRLMKKVSIRKSALAFIAAFVVASYTGWKAYDRAFLSRHGLVGEYFLDEDLQTSFGKRQDRAIRFRWLRRPPMRDFRAEHFSIRWTGFVKTAQDGRHEFYTVSDDGVRLWVDDQKLIDNWTIHSGALDKGEINLRPGYHRIVLEYFQGAGDSVIKLQWKRPADEEKRDVPARFLFPKLPED